MTSIGEPLDRVDGPAKVTGAARYAAEWPVRGVTHAVIVTSRIASGRVAGIDASAAQRASGVIAVMTHDNAPRLVPDKDDHVLTILQDDRVWFQNQPVAVVVADTFEHATDAASRVVVRYESTEAINDMDPLLDTAHAPPSDSDGWASSRGDVASALDSAPVRVEQTYTTPVEHHNPMEPFATIATWDDSRTHLMLYSSTQGVWGEKRAIAGRLGLPLDNVRVVAKYIGGGFGCKGTTWSPSVLAAMAAKQVGRPVKLVLTRAQMFGPVGMRPRTVQRIALGATKDGKLTAVRHDGISHTSRFYDWTEPVAITTRSLYSCPNLSTSHKIVPINTGTPWYMRAPGEATGLFALESAMDELAYGLRMDPMQLRLVNYADQDEQLRLPWSSKALKACYSAAAEQFGWARRTPEPRSMRDGDVLVGLGMASSARPVRRSKAAAKVRLNADGTAVVQCGTQDIGTGTYTIMTQVAADALGLEPRQVRMDIGDTNFPESPTSNGSRTTTSTSAAVQAACEDLKQRLVQRAGRDGQPADLLRQLKLPSAEGNAETQPGDEREKYSMYAFGAIFTEVRVDPDYGTVRVSRVVGRYCAGRILNVKTARSQITGAIVWGIGMALMEQTVSDVRTGRVVNMDLAEYHVPVEADVPNLDVEFVEEHDPYVDPLGVKGLGELGIIGVAGAIANAVYHATGVRVRDLPVTLDKVIAPANARVS
jgi:xanthine dehydrogenase YagR molybdenum-binding subunit